jgi:hypothetical protein
MSLYQDKLLSSLLRLAFPTLRTLEPIRMRHKVHDRFPNVFPIRHYERAMPYNFLVERKTCNKNKATILCCSLRYLRFEAIALLFQRRNVVLADKF